MKSSPPKPPLMRVGANGYPCPLCGSGMKPKGPFGVLVSEYKTVDWCTDMGKLVDESTLSTKLPKTWFGRLFMSGDQKMLERSLTRNRMLCTEWPR